jgi:hypothetical protein
LTWTALLLADPSPCLRSLVLRELLHRSDNDPEVQELEGLREADPIVLRVLSLQSSDGSWGAAGIGGNGSSDRIQATSQALTKLGYLGFGSDHPSVRHGAAYLFSKQQKEGGWPRPMKYEREGREQEGYTMIPLQTAFPLRGLAMCGYATDPRAERAYDWLLKQRLEDGAWPTGKAGEVYGFVAGYRRLAHSRWGCRSNTTASLLCLSLHPTRRFSQESRRALDLLLGRETHEKQNIGFEVARIIGAEPESGYITYFAKFDLALILDLCSRIGADRSDERISELVDFMIDVRGSYGLWEYTPHPEASRWVTFDLLRSLSRLDDSMGWLSLEPRMPFRAYLKKQKRF